jgi:hypothetical protein
MSAVWELLAPVDAKLEPEAAELATCDESAEPEPVVDEPFDAEPFDVELVDPDVEPLAELPVPAAAVELLEPEPPFGVVAVLALELAVELLLAAGAVVVPLAAAVDEEPAPAAGCPVDPTFSTAGSFALGWVACVVAGA